MALYVKYNKKDISRELYDSWSEHKREFFDNVLPWMLMSVSVRFVSESTVKLIVERFKLSNGAWHADVTKRVHEVGYKSVEDYLTKECIGFSANIHFEDNRGFLSQIGKRLPRCPKRVINQMEKEFFKEEYLECSV